MFSTTTMELSTSMPRARISEKSTTMFSVMPRACSTMKLMSMDMGMATATKDALRVPMANSSTASTRIRPVMMLFSRSATMSLTNSLLSWRTVYVVPAGSVGSASASTARTSREMRTMFSPARFLTRRVTHAVPLMREMVSRSLNPSTTLPRSASRTGSPAGDLITTRSMRRMSRNSPGMRTAYLLPPSWRLPAGVVRCSCWTLRITWPRPTAWCSSLRGSSSTCTSRSRPPVRSTPSTPLTCSIFSSRDSATCLSFACPYSPETLTSIMGNSERLISMSAGSSASAGSFAFALSTWSRIFW